MVIKKLGYGLSLVLLLNGCFSPSTLELTLEQWTQIAQENSQISATEIRQTAQITPLKDHRIWIDFNSPKLCGHEYCLYAIYQLNPQTAQITLRWQAYLNPSLPPKISLMEPEQDSNCLLIHQFKRYIKKYQLCPQGINYQISKIGEN